MLERQFCETFFQPFANLRAKFYSVDLSKLYRPSALNSFQFIALTGLLMSAGAHLILHFAVGHTPTGFNWLYVSWTAFYVVGTLINLFGKPDEPHDHH